MPAAAAPTRTTAAGPGAPAGGGATELERTAPAVPPERSAQSASLASGTVESVVGPAEPSATAAVGVSPGSAPPVESVADPAAPSAAAAVGASPGSAPVESVAGPAAPSAAAAVGASPGSAPPIAPESPARSARSVGAASAPPGAATPGSPLGQAGAPSAEESVSGPSGSPASIGSGSIAGAAVGRAAADSLAGPRQRTGSGLKVEPGPGTDVRAGLPAQAVIPGPGEPGASGSTTSPGGTRVRDWLRPPAATGAALAARVSAFARSLGHLSWSDERLGRRAAQGGPAAAADGDELASSSRAAAAPARPMVQATELTPRAAARGARQPSKLATEAATSPRSGEPPRQPLVALPMAGEGGPSLPGQAAWSAGASPRPAGSTESAAAASEFVAAMAAGSRGQARPGPAAAPSDSESELARPAGALAALAAPQPDPAGRIGGGAGTASSSLSPSLLDSSALRRPWAAGGPASFVELFLAGQTARMALPSAWTLPSLATNQPYRTPGALGLHTEQMANVIGTHAAAGSAGVDNPFGGAQRWRSAPGLAGTVARALGSAAPPGAARWAQLSLSKELPYLESPDSELDEQTPPAAGASARTAEAATGTLSLPLAPPARGPREEAAPLAARQPASGPLSPAAPLTSLAEPSGEGGAPRPWQLAGGMATLAELFAAGVGLGSGAAVDLASKAGVAPAAGLMPPWLSKATGQSSLALLGLPGDAAGPRITEPGSSDAAAAAAHAGGPLARALRRADAASSGGASPAQLATQPTAGAVAFAPAASDKPARTAALPFWQQAGGLAATAEAFARGHGIERAESRALGASARATASLRPDTPSLR